MPEESVGWRLETRVNLFEIASMDYRTFIAVSGGSPLNAQLRIEYASGESRSWSGDEAIQLYARLCHLADTHPVLSFAMISGKGDRF